MHIVPVVGSVVGATTTSCWAQTIKTPSVYGLVEVYASSENAQEIGMKVIAQILEACSQPIGNLKILETLVEHIVVPEVQSIILFVPVGLDIYVVIAGEGAVYIKRNDTYAKLLDTHGAISGSVERGDVIILLSKSCKKILPEQELFGIFDHLSADILAEKLTLLLEGKEEVCGCAALLFEAKEIQNDHEISDEVSVQPPARVPKIIPFIKKQIYRIRHVKQTPGLWITTLLIAIFLISIVIGIQREILVKKDTKMQTVVQETERMYEEGQALLELNAVKGRERLMQAKILLAPVADIVSDKTKEERYVTELYRRITETLTTAMHIYTQEPQVFYDVALLKSEGTVTAIGVSSDTLVIGDAQQKAVYAISISSKTGTIIGGGAGFENISAVDVQGTTVYVFTPEGVHKITTDNASKTLASIKKGSEWGVIRAMSVFGGSVYLLDTQNSRIWKYIATDSGFSELKEYLNPDTLPDLSRASSMAIDGSVWLGSSDGKILRFTQGKENTFVSKGIEPPLGQHLFVYTSDETKNLYILDTNNKRVVVVDKEGIYLAQYAWTSEVVPSQLAVSEKQGKILLLAAGKLFSIDLR